MDAQRKIELLQAEADEDTESYFRILVDNVFIKYITIEAGIYSMEDMCFGPSLASILPKLPPGDWNDGLVAKDAKDLSIGEKLRTGIYEVQFPSLEGAVVAKFARFDWEIQYMENETTAYQWISGHDIGPRFLGHLTEHGRVIGFLIERITDARHAEIQDLETCREVLSRLHGLGVRHGDTNRFNFLVSDSKTVLIDFDTARKCADQGLLLQEMEDLTACFEDPSGRGGGGLL